MTASDLPDANDSIEINLRPVLELVGRAAVLAAVARRGMLETTAGSDAYATDTDRFDLYSWARAELHEWATPAEVRLLTASIGQMTDDDLSECDAALIGASSIAWALNAASGDRLLLPPDGDAEQETLEWAPEPWVSIPQAARKESTRVEAEIAAERERWELWYWRVMDADHGSDELAEVVASLRETGLLPVAADDLATDGGIPFHAVDPDGQGEIAWLAELRLRALNWVCGFGASWDDVPLYPD